MSINTYLQDLGKSLVLNTFEKASISTSIDTLKSRLSLYFDDVIEKKLYGSYVRDTILPRKADEKSDVDLMVVFDNPYGYQPQSFLNKLKNFSEYYYSKSVIHQSNPTIVLELNHIKFELTPAYKVFGMYQIPQDRSSWMRTDPDGFYAKLKECNKNNNYIIKPIVRILKYWNIQKNDRDLKSYSLEKKISNELLYAYYNCTSYTDYLKCALGKIQFDTDCVHVGKALKCIDDALQLEKDNYPNMALGEIKKAFPEI